MRVKPSYRAVTFSRNRKMVAASLSTARYQHNVHLLLEADVTAVRDAIRSHRKRTGERLSLTAYVIACLGRAVREHPGLNAFRRGRKLIRLDEITVGAMVERDIDGEPVPEPVGVRGADKQTYRQIHDVLRDAATRRTRDLGELGGAGLVRSVPGWLLRLFVRAAQRSITMNDRYGVFCVTAIGMFGPPCMTPIPLVAGATVAVAVGGIARRVVLVGRTPCEREYLRLSVTFNHDIVDGSPAARFAKDFVALLESGKPLEIDMSRREEAVVP